MGEDRKVRFANNWVRELLPPRPNPLEGTVVGLQNLSAGTDDSTEILPDALGIESLLSAMHPSDGDGPSLLDCLKGRQRLAEGTKFAYEGLEKECFFTVKECMVRFKKELCTAVVMNDYTAFHQLSKLEDKYRKILLASVVHDFRTPIQGITGILETLNTSQRTEEERECLHIGLNTCRLLIFFTYDITDLGQIEAGKFKVTLGTFAPTVAVKDCINALTFSYKAKGINLVLSPGALDSRTTICSDEHRYMQIIMNLLGNAQKFTLRNGTVTVSLSVDEARGLLTTEVSDTGVGIKEEDIPHLFKLFGKLEATSSLNPHGVGLGLTMCKRLSEALGGKITVRSRPGMGSNFVFTISTNPGRPVSAAVSDVPGSEYPAQLATDPRSFIVHDSRFICSHNLNVCALVSIHIIGTDIGIATAKRLQLPPPAGRGRQPAQRVRDAGVCEGSGHYVRRGTARCDKGVLGNERRGGGEEGAGKGGKQVLQGLRASAHGHQHANHGRHRGWDRHIEICKRRESAEGAAAGGTDRRRVL